MTVVYDLQGTQSIHHGERGIARYVLELALALDRVAPGLVDLFAYNPDLPVPATLEPFRASGRLVAGDDDRVSTCRLFHMASPMENGIPGHRLLPPAVRRRAVVVATVYDLIPLVYAEHYLVGRQNQAEYARGLAAVQAADELLAISHATADDAARLLGIASRRITTIGAGAGERFRRPDPGDAEGLWRRLSTHLPGLRRGFVLVPTGIDFRKNVEGTIESYGLLPPALRDRHQLVIACRVDDDARRRIVDLATRHGVGDDVLLTGFVSDELLVSLYQESRVVVFPSRYEGFGLPPLEARQCGAPVICGDNSSLREVIVDPRARFDADAPADIARVLTRVLTDDRFRRSLVDAPLPDVSWERAATVTAGVYRRLLAADQRAPGRPRTIGVLVPEDGAVGVVARLAGAVRPDARLIVLDDEPGVVGLHVEAGLLDAVVAVRAPDDGHGPTGVTAAADLVVPDDVASLDVVAVRQLFEAAGGRQPRLR